MPLIATLVSRPTERALSLSLANMASRSVGASAVVWLAEGIACDLVLPEAADAAAASAVLRT
ncbi:phosphoserine phosphatase SerB, partial [Mesorhizobium sp. M7A.F.Ca.CA.001.13.2.1]